jgi:hypothetical protein
VIVWSGGGVSSSILADGEVGLFLSLLLESWDVLLGVRFSGAIVRW